MDHPGNGVQIVLYEKGEGDEAGFWLQNAPGDEFQRPHIQQDEATCLMYFMAVSLPRGLPQQLLSSAFASLDLSLTDVDSARQPSIFDFRMAYRAAERLHQLTIWTPK